MHLSQRVNKVKFVSRATTRQRGIAAIVFLAIAVFFVFLHIAASGKINIGQWLGYCGFKQRWGLPCPTCGMTTSALAFAQGKILRSFYIQPAGGFFCSVLAILAFLSFITAVFGVYITFFKRFFTEIKVKYVILAIFVVIIAGWAVTLTRALATKNQY